MRRRPNLSALLILAILAVAIAAMPALAQSSPPVIGPTPPIQAGAGLTACLAWTDGCVICRRTNDAIACSNIGTACQPVAARCTEDAAQSTPEKQNEAPKKGLGRLKAYKNLPVLKAVLAAHAGKHVLSKDIERQANAA